MKNSEMPVPCDAYNFFNNSDPLILCYYHTDHLGTPQQMTDSAGTTVWKASYEPFGQAVVTNQTIQNNVRLAGQYFDQETGLHYNNARYYDPKVGRYISSDPIGLDGGLNTYLYAFANPLRYTDPTGLDVTITYFPGGPGHIGIGVNSPNTSGLYPQRKSAAVVFCRDVPGAVLPDQARQNQSSRAKSRSVTIKTSSAQDTVVQTIIENAKNNSQQEYNLCSNQCTNFVRNALQAGGVVIPGDNGSIVPIRYFEQIEKAYGGKQQ